MPSNLFSPMHLLIVLAIILVLFGAAKLPALAKSMGQSARAFKGEMNTMKDEDAERAAAKAAAATATEGTVVSEVASTQTPKSPDSPTS